VTFTFEDGTIRTINSQSDSGSNTLGGKMLGYIATRQGNPCLAGQLITNAQDYLMDRMLASGAAALASSFSDTQKTTRENSDGTTTSFLSGDNGEYIAGETLAGSLTELTAYLRERQRNAVDLVYLNAGQDVVLHVESQIEIDYEPEGRKLDHASDHAKQVGYYLD
jgi:integrating conjugative element protein (TIGR03752 family)